MKGLANGRSISQSGLAPRSPDEIGFDPKRLALAKQWLDEQARQREDGRYRVVIVRGGYLIAEWYLGVERDEQLRLASATKSIFSSILGIAIDEGVIPSADGRVADIYPEMMDVPDGAGPKPGRYAFEKDRAITFRQLISNTSGYMKPGEEPGHTFHYQTYGMNILTHAIAKRYGLYDVSDPEGSPGLKQLIDSRLKEPIGADWGYYLNNFALHAKGAPPHFRLLRWGQVIGVGHGAFGLALAPMGPLAGSAGDPRSVAACGGASQPGHSQALSTGSVAIWLWLLEQPIRHPLAQLALGFLRCVRRRQPTYLGLP